VICKHCGQSITNIDSDGKVCLWYVHTKNGYMGKRRCDTDLTGKPYGLEAEPAA